MNTNRKIALGAALALALGVSLGVTGCSSNVPTSLPAVQAPAPVADPSSIYLDAVHTAAPETIGMDDASVVKIGKLICSTLDDGTPFSVMANMVLQAAISNGVSAKASGAMIGAAVVSFCPQYKSDMEAFVSAYN